MNHGFAQDQAAGLLPWNVQAAEIDEAYIWRGFVHGISPRNISDMQAIARAVGEQDDLRLDLRGITMQTAGPSDLWQLDAVFTSRFPQLFITTPIGGKPIGFGNRVVNALRERFPTAALQSASYLQFADDPKHPALDFWISRDIIWDRWLGPITEHGKPTGAFANFEGLYAGSAEQGHALKSWPKDGGGSFRPPPGNGTSNGESDSTLLWIAAGVITIGLASWVASRGVGAA